MQTLNLGILAHVDAGKTSLTERLLYAAGVIDKVGSVDDGSTHTDSLSFAQVGANGKVALYNGSAGTVQLVADVSGYYLAGSPTVEGTFGSLTATRVLDTRTGLGAPKAAVAAGGTVHLQVAGMGGVPSSGVSAVMLNVTVTAAFG